MHIVTNSINAEYYSGHDQIIPCPMMNRAQRQNRADLICVADCKHNTVR